MNGACYPLDELERVAALPAGDPGLAHLAGCPRCRARLASYRSFAAGAAAAGADPDDAEGRLAQALHRAIAETPRARSRRFGPPAHGAWRPALALAAVLVAAVGLWRFAATPRPGAVEPPVLRGETVAAPAPVPLAGRALADGRLVLSWRRQPGADAYRVALHGADLAEAARVEAGNDSTVSVSPGAARFWRVIALRGGDEIGRSALAPLRPAE